MRASTTAAAPTAAPARARHPDRVAPTGPAGARAARAPPPALGGLGPAGTAGPAPGVAAPGDPRSDDANGVVSMPCGAEGPRLSALGTVTFPASPVPVAKSPGEAPGAVETGRVSGPGRLKATWSVGPPARMTTPTAPSCRNGEASKLTAVLAASTLPTFSACAQS